VSRRTRLHAGSGTAGPEAAYFAPPLTTIRQDFDRMGKQAIRVLLAELAGEQPADNPLLRLHLVTRDSTAPPSRL